MIPLSHAISFRQDRTDLGGGDFALLSICFCLSILLLNLLDFLLHISFRVLFLFPFTFGIDINVGADILLGDFAGFVGAARISGSGCGGIIGFFFEAGDFCFGFLYVLKKGIKYGRQSCLGVARRRGDMGEVWARRRIVRGGF